MNDLVIYLLLYKIKYNKNIYLNNLFMQTIASYTKLYLQ